ncbi:MAG: adenylate/guanylate cyclase domain-containing protein [Rhodospirillaceae bacterium]|nr:adenylate/guanylate cyclase domain-containing protein [Rhodospirillaceae bacterium]
MALGDDLNSQVVQIFREQWTTSSGRVVPEPDDLALRNDAVVIDGTVLYADLDESTELVNKMKPGFAAEIYKAFLGCAARITRAEGGEITGYDGDRIMAVFTGKRRNSKAARTGLKINYAVSKIINPALECQYPNDRYTVKHQVGIDTSRLFVTRTGIRGANDLVWVGRAANYAAKLSARSGASTQITAAVYNQLSRDTKISSDGRSMWTQQTAAEIGGATIYTSTWRWEV